MQSGLGVQWLMHFVLQVSHLDSIHALWGCQTVKHIWWELECCKNFLSERFVSFRDLFQGILAQKNQHMVELFAYMRWSLWFNRNAKRVGSTSLPIAKFSVMLWNGCKSITRCKIIQHNRMWFLTQPNGGLPHIQSTK